jgi:hypothetical protein
VSVPGTARACRVHRPARVVDGTAAPRQKPSSNSSRRWAFDMSQGFCAAGIAEDRADSIAPTSSLRALWHLRGVPEVAVQELAGSPTCSTTSTADQVSWLAATFSVEPEVWRAMGSK